MSIFIGIDPGLFGAVAGIDHRGNIISVQDTPIVKVKKSKGYKNTYIESQMATILNGLIEAAGATGCQVMLENVHAMPGQGVTAMFNMGVGLGLWRGIIATLRLPVTFVEPATWKKEVGILKGSDKGQSIVRAAQLFPKADLARKKDDGRADALLMAECLRRRTVKGSDFGYARTRKSK
jgi:crossover junction endodeoxyribonuclease RuvC